MPYGNNQILILEGKYSASIWPRQYLSAQPPG
jgi:hypothetical protein